ncbi:receptor-type tyrosine-protein phosphatase mu-like isoform X2 [Physella acuta]|uniref:receptor-type tyrosine-protein phosphatase mu-like isoform X2 n=1 Tax=Physella acuta TaxID=109671 RepID=UPI0027DB9FE0|nr:receptor-type tyrosine-protein phosphatase mu-like isoform X2 [Physella acuta]
MTMSKNLVSCLGVKVSQLKVMCGLSMDPDSREQRAIDSVVGEAIPACNFVNVYRQKRQEKQLAIEFKAVMKNQEEHTSSAALRNVLLNTKQDVVTYDHSRVIVWDSPDDVGTDYYNASFVDGYSGLKEYIVSQGPSTKCLVSFWHMLWQEGVTTVVMATGLFENAVCEKYWVDHTRRHAKHGHIHIWHEASNYLAQLNIRTFRIQKEGCCESRILTHYEMIGFHDESPDPGLLLDVRRRVNSVPRPGPTLVHCRCGGGRTAVYVAVDYCLHQLQAEDRVDVYSAVLHLRRFRKNMVRTVSQYQQIYEAVAMYLQCGITVYPVHSFLATYNVHYAHGCDSKNKKLEREFQALQALVPRLSIGDCASGHRVENRNKSRDIMMLPPECARPYLSTADCGDCGTDFINAVYINGYHTEHSYLVTQWPMRKTIADLWRLVIDFKITSLVFMNDPSKFSRNYPRFWPREIDQVANYGPISVRYLACERINHLVTRTFAIRKPKRHPHLIAQALISISEDMMIMNNLIGCEVRQDEVIVKMFQVMSLGGSVGVSRSSSRSRRRGSVDGTQSDGDKRRSSSTGGVGIMSKSLLAVMEGAVDWQRRCNNRQPICVISKDGCSRVGLFCAISVCCDQVRSEREVDVLNAVRMIRKNRPQLVPNIEEYRYIYHFMTEFILLSASRPDIVVSEHHTDPLPHTVSMHRITSPPLSTNHLHGGVYIMSADSADAHKLQCFGTNFHSSACNSNLTERQDLSCRNSDTINSSQASASIDNYETRTSKDRRLINHNSFHSQHQDNNVAENGLILSASALVTDGNHHTTPHHCTNGLSAQANQLCLPPFFNESQSVSTVSCSAGQTLPPPSLLQPPPHISSSSFLAPDVFLQGQQLPTNSTNQNQSPRSFCRSSSFCSCHSHLSHPSDSPTTRQLPTLSSSDSPRNRLPPKPANGVALSTGLMNGLQQCLVCDLASHNSRATRPSNLGLGNPEVSQTSSLHLQPERLYKKSESSTTGDVTLIHASYASLEESPSSSEDERDANSTCDWLEEIPTSKKKKSATFLPSYAQLTSNNGQAVTHLTDDTRNNVKKNIASAIKEKLKAYRYKRSIKDT